MIQPRPIELLAPAANADIAIEAILHGADAVYIGGPGHGARKAAANSIEDIRRVVDFAHPFGVKVYVTVNTIVYDRELDDVRALITDLYRIGVDALIVQDMAIFRLDLPPIALHASTQCDTRTPEKARFLQDIGASQIVLAREMTLEEIHSIAEAVTVPIECFVHGALCVSYSGRCHASQSICGRSANRGECAQICRLPFTLSDASGRVLARNRHLLSLKDFNASARLEEMLRAGVSSFKIEGRLKDASYVKNIVAYYRRLLDEIISANPENLRRASFGTSEISFTPAPEKSFNRGFTHYFLDERRPHAISQPMTPKSMGEEISDVSTLNNGDGLSYFNEQGEYVGVLVNGVRNGRIIANKPFKLPKGERLHRTLDIQWQKTLAKPTATRRLDLDIILRHNSISATDERGTSATVRCDFDIQPAKTPKDLRSVFDKFGNTIYRLRGFDIDLSATGLKDDAQIFIPASQLAEARRMLLEAMAAASKASYEFDRRRPEDPAAVYPKKQLDYQDNVANRLAETFYRQHGVIEIGPALETQGKEESRKGGRSVMTTRHCILREMGLCLKETPAAKRPFKLPLTITAPAGNQTGNEKGAAFRLQFDCDRCEMHLLTTP